MVHPAWRWVARKAGLISFEGWVSWHISSTSGLIWTYGVFVRLSAWQLQETVSVTFDDCLYTKKTMKQIHVNHRLYNSWFMGAPLSPYQPAQLIINRQVLKWLVARSSHGMWLPAMICGVGTPPAATSQRQAMTTSEVFPHQRLGWIGQQCRREHLVMLWPCEAQSCSETRSCAVALANMGRKSHHLASKRWWSCDLLWITLGQLGSNR